MKVIIATGIILIIAALQIHALPASESEASLKDLKAAFENFMQQQTNEGNTNKTTEVEHVPLSKQDTDGDFSNDDEDMASSESLRYRLRNGGNACRGRVEVFFGGRWGSVCDDHFGLNEARVVCHSIGYRRAIAVRSRAYFGRAPLNYPIWLDDVDCRGDESEIAQCAHLKFGSHNCGHGEDVGVICAGY